MTEIPTPGQFNNIFADPIRQEERLRLMRHQFDALIAHQAAAKASRFSETVTPMKALHIFPRRNAKSCLAPTGAGKGCTGILWRIAG